MNQRLENALPIGYALVAFLLGAVAYRACLTGRGFGNSVTTAWFASFATFVMAFVVFIVINDALPPRRSLAVIITLLLLGACVHLFAF